MWLRRANDCFAFYYLPYIQTHSCSELELGLGISTALDPDGYLSASNNHRLDC